MSHVLKHARTLLAGIETRHMSPADRERLRKIDACLIGAGAESTHYENAMHDLSDATWAAVRAAINEDGAPVEALKKIAADIDSLIDCALTRKEFDDMKSLYDGAKLAGLT